MTDIIKNKAGKAIKSPVWKTLSSMRKAWVGVGVLSLFVNVLMLTGPLYMLQVYDRVITSQSMSTLVVLSVLMVAMYGFMGLMDFLRSRILVRIGNFVESELSAPIFKSWLAQGVRGKVGPGQRPLQSLSVLKRFLTGPSPTTFFDIPWTPVYIAVIFMIDWTLGVFAIVGALLVLAIAIAAELRTRKNEKTSQSARSKSNLFTQKIYSNSESVVSMGMVGDLTKRWNAIKDSGIESDLSASDISGGATAISKAFRMFLQSAILGIGAALAVQQIISPGAMIAGSIILGRALAPIQMVISQWRNWIQTKSAYRDLNKFYETLPAAVQKVALPTPTGKISVSKVSAGPPNAKLATLKGINFDLLPGDGLCILGNSGSGKSSLARLLVGIWMPQMGSVRLNGATFDQWDNSDLGEHIGYLPQTVELFDGTVGENISRFKLDASSDMIIRAAQIAGIHDFILSLPEGYNTNLGTGGVVLSVGQVQRVALARALFGDPCLIVLDEPNSNLDKHGDKALNAAIQYMRTQKKTVIIVSHRKVALAAVNKVLVLNGGQQEKFGPKDAVLKTENRGPSKQAVSKIKQAQERARQMQRAHANNHHANNHGVQNQGGYSQAANPQAGKPHNPYQNKRA